MNLTKEQREFNRGFESGKNAMQKIPHVSTKSHLALLAENFKKASNPNANQSENVRSYWQGWLAGIETNKKLT